MDKLRMTSPDLTDANISKLAELFPSVITEATDAEGNVTRAVDFDLLRQELSDHIVEGPQERYRLDWPGKRQAAFTANAPIAKTLRPVRAESVDFDTTKNVFIEGDNLEALKLLQESYLGRVKMIYIDPPYNTGHDFVYHDDFSESRAGYLERSEQYSEQGEQLVSNTESNGRFHSDWLNMIYPRLKLARNLLAKDGLIFISIDDNEVDSLKRMLSEVFGPGNMVASIAWEKRYTRSNNANGFYSLKDTILLCRRSSSAASIKELRNDSSAVIYSNPDDDPRGPWTSSSYVNPATKEARPNLSYSISRPKDGATVNHPTHAWKFQRSEHDRHVQEDRLWWGKNGLAQYPRLKVFLGEMGDGMVPVDLWSREDAGTTDEGGAQVKDLFGAAVFDFPKPTKLIKKMMDIFVPPSSQWFDEFIVMDFFAGSSSTAQAVMEKNIEDGRNRSFIMVQLPEKVDSRSIAAKQGFSNISQISMERIRRAAEQISAGVDSDSWDSGFRAFCIDSSNMADSLRTPDDIEQLDLSLFEGSIKDGRTGEDLLFQVFLDWGLELSMPISKEVFDGREVFFVEEDALSACFDREVSLDVVREMARRQPLRAVFRDDGFVDDAARINAEQIFRELSPNTEVKAI